MGGRYWCKDNMCPGRLGAARHWRHQCSWLADSVKFFEIRGVWAEDWLSNARGRVGGGGSTGAIYRIGGSYLGYSSSTAQLKVCISGKNHLRVTGRGGLGAISPFFGNR